MFKYTKASVNILIDDFKKFAKIFRYASMVFTIGFLAYQIASGKGFLAVNIVLASFFVIFTTLDFIFEYKNLDFARKIFKRVYKWLKIAIKAFTLIMSVLEIYNAEVVDGISIILATLMILLWVVSFVSEILVEVATDRCEEMLIAFKADVDDIKRPFTAVSNTFKKITGKKIDEVKVDTKKEKVLSKLNERINKDKIKDEDDDEIEVVEH